jgi:hypothetical protein
MVLFLNSHFLVGKAEELQQLLIPCIFECFLASIPFLSLESIDSHFLVYPNIK